VAKRGRPKSATKLKPFEERVAADIEDGTGRRPPSRRPMVREPRDYFTLVKMSVFPIPVLSIAVFRPSTQTG
jgi:hypothetical protein